MIKFSTFKHFVKILFLISILFSGITDGIIAQEWKDVKSSSQRPLTLKAQGSFYVGGETVSQSFDELGSFGPGNNITVNQMYVRYMIPNVRKPKLPIVMIHGMALTSKSWETTPDGRMGWDEYFVRKKHPTFVVDQVARGRSGFNQAILNNIRTKKVAADSLLPVRRFSDEWVWPNFRVGLEENEPYSNTLFPTDYMGELSKQGVPDLSGTLPDYSLNYKSLAELACELGKAVLISHSQSGVFPMQAALINPKGIAAIVSLEPGWCSMRLNAEQVKILAGIPILIVFGDYLETPIRDEAFWLNACEDCESFSENLNKAGGNAKVLRLSEEGIKGNSHMLMQDKNNLQIADLVLKWIGENTEQ